MLRITGAAAATSLLATTALAGGVERTSFSSAILFEEGSYSQLSFGFVAPSVSGEQFGTGASSGDVFNDYFSWSLAYKTDLGERLSAAIIIDQPIGADTLYPDSDYAIAGTSAQLENIGVTALLKYELPSNFSIYGGIRALQTSGVVDLPFVPTTGYSLETSSELDFGYIVGAAWEKPEIAARVALTYISSITQTFDATENGTESLPFSTIIPQTLKLEAQTGVAEDTLVFGSIQWTDWSVFDISPAGFAAATEGGSLVDFQSDTYTYTLGVGRRFNEQWSGAVIATYEPKTGDVSGNLGPTDGRASLGLAGTYSPTERMEITAGLTYIAVGGTTTAFGEFEGNSAVAAGFRVGMSY